MQALRRLRPVTAAFIGCAAFPAAAAYNGTDSYQDLANTTLECATAMQYSEDHGEPLRFSSAVLFDEFLDTLAAEPGQRAGHDESHPGQ